MNKKDYAAIAHAIQQVSSRNPSTIDQCTISAVAHLLCETFKADNPLFRADLFIAACKTA